MRLRQIFDILKNTELKQIVVGEDDDQIIALMNLALIEVYSKFNILQEEQIIDCQDGKTRYLLQDNAQKVIQAYFRNLVAHPLNGDDQYREVPINDINDEESIFIPEPYTVHIPNAKAGRQYSLILIVTPPYVTKDNIDTLDFNVPPQFLMPINNFAAYRAYKSMNNSADQETWVHWKAYKESCDDVYKNGLVQTQTITNMKAVDRGYPTSNVSSYEGD